MKKIAAVDVIVELVFGLAVGGMSFFLLASGSGSDSVPFPLVALGVFLTLAQTVVDLIRGRGWRYASVCGAVYGAAVVTGGYAALIATIVYWAVMSTGC